MGTKRRNHFIFKICFVIFLKSSPRACNSWWADGPVFRGIPVHQNGRCWHHFVCFVGHALLDSVVSCTSTRFFCGCRRLMRRPPHRTRLWLFLPAIAELDLAPCSPFVHHGLHVCNQVLWKKWAHSVFHVDSCTNPPRVFVYEILIAFPPFFGRAGTIHVQHLLIDRTGFFAFDSLYTRKVDPAKIIRVGFPCITIIVLKSARYVAEMQKVDEILAMALDQFYDMRHVRRLFHFFQLSQKCIVHVFDAVDETAKRGNIRELTL